MIKVLIVSVVISTVVTVTPAAVKREEYVASNGSSGSASNTNSQPVYSPSASSGSYSNGGSNAYNSNAYSNRDNYVGTNSVNSQYSVEHSGSAPTSSASYQSQPSSQGNLYYYYYPVQEKPKDSTYHTSSSNQYNNAVNPSASGVASGQVSGESAPHSSLEPAASGQDLSYSAQDISYSSQNLGQGIGSEYNSQSGASYDQQLSNLASQLQQYGFASGSGSSAFNPSAYSSGSQGSYPSNTFDSTGPNYGSASSPSATFGSQSDALHSASSHPSYSAAAAATSFGSQSGSQIGYSPQGNAYPYNGQHTYGNYASASGPQATYEPPSSGFRRYGLSSILMPMLALAGLSLLIPTVTSLGSTGRRKRAIDDNVKDSTMNGYIDKLERYYSIYRTAVEKEECMNRIICELGDAMSGVRGKSTVLTVMEKIVPNWMVNKMGVFKHAALSADNGKCKKYMC